MPSAWKKAKLGGIPRLLASSLGSGAKGGVGESPLVVQAGFPTSVADLLVKNRARLKKTTPQWMRRRRTGGDEAEVGCTAMASVRPEIIAAAGAARPPRPPQGLPGSEQKEEGQRLAVPTRVKPRRGAISEKGPGRSLMASEAAREAGGLASEASTGPKPEKNAPEGRNSWGFMTPATVGFLVFILAIGTRKIALAASISAFTILLLEWTCRRLIPFFKSFGESKNSLSTVASSLLRPPGGPDSSSNEEIRIRNSSGFCDPDPGSLRSKRSFESKALVEVTAPVVQPPTPALERKDRVEAEGSRRDRKALTGNRKVKKLLRKLVPKKLREAKNGKAGKVGGEADPPSDSSSKGASGQIGEGVETVEEAEVGGAVDDDDRDEEAGGVDLGFEVLPEVQIVGLEDAALLGEKMDGPTNENSKHLVFFLIVLSGLVGGRVAAMALTVVWYLLSPSIGSLWRSWKIHQSQ